MEHYLFAVTGRGEHCACGEVSASILQHLANVELCRYVWEVAA